MYVLGFISEGNGFGGKVFGVVVLDDAKRGWVVEQDFYRNSQVSFMWFLPFCPTLLTKSCSLWFGLKNLFPCNKVVFDVTGLRGTTVRPGGSGANGLIRVLTRHDLRLVRYNSIKHALAHGTCVMSIEQTGNRHVSLNL